jgi:hypothetical protein
MLTLPSTRDTRRDNKSNLCLGLYTPGSRPTVVTKTLIHSSSVKQPLASLIMPGSVSGAWNGLNSVTATETYLPQTSIGLTLFSVINPHIPLTSIALFLSTMSTGTSTHMSSD